MFGTIRKHQTWLWAIIIAVIVVSFVIFFSPDAQWNMGGGQGSFGSIDGRPITQQEFSQAYRETKLLYFLNFQKWPESDERARQMGFDLENETYMRLLRLAKVKEANIRVSDETLAHLARRLLGPKTPLDAFVEEYLKPNGISVQDFERFLRNDAAIQQLGAVAGLPGKLVPPREIRETYREENQELALEAVFFSVSNYLPRVTVTDSNVVQWYSNNMSLFRVPEKARVSYVDFHRSNFLAEAQQRFSEITNLDLQIEQLYVRQDPASFTDESGKVLSKEAAIEQIKETERDKMAMLLAARKANEFASKLYDHTDHTLEGFERFAAAEGYKTHVSEPFDEIEGPKELNVPDAFARAAFNLTNTQEAISIQPIQGEDAYYVFALKETIPSSNPSFAEIRDEVVERYRFSEAQKLVRQAGMGFYFRLTNGLAQGQTFSQVVTQSNLKPVTLPPISRNTRQVPELPESVNIRYVQNVAFSLEPGEASPYIPTYEGGFVLYLRAQLPIDETKMQAELPQYAAYVRNQRQNEIFGLWFRKQAERANLPLNRPAGPGGAGAAPTPAPQ